MAKKKEIKLSNKRDIQVKFLFSEIEKEEFDKFVINSYLNKSEVIRNAIFNYIRGKSTNTSTIPGNFSNENTTKILNELGVITNKFSEFIKISGMIENNKKSFQTRLGEDINLRENIGRIVKTLKQYRTTHDYKSNKTTMSMEKIILASGLDRELVFDILINHGSFKQKGKGWDLNE